MDDKIMLHKVTIYVTDGNMQGIEEVIEDLQLGLEYRFGPMVVDNTQTVLLDWQDGNIDINNRDCTAEDCAKYF